MPKIKFEIVLSDARVQKAVDAIVRCGPAPKDWRRTNIVVAIDEVIRIRTSEKGEVAV